MNSFVRTGAVALGAALLSAPVAANAETEHLTLKRDRDLPAHADLTGLSVNNTKHRVVASLRLPKVRTAKLDSVGIRLRPRTGNIAWRARVNFNRSGAVRSRTVSMRRIGQDGVVVRWCPRLRINSSKHRIRLALPRRCMTFGYTQRGSVKVRGALHDRDALSGEASDLTPFTRVLRRG